MKKSFVLIVIGILLLVLDYRIPVGKEYPQMLEARDLGLEFQGKVINHFIGDRPALDIIPDVLGFALIFVGSVFLVRKNYRFLLAMVLVPAAVYLSIVIPQLPYHFQTKDLYLKSAGYNFLLVAVEIGIEFFIIHGIVSITNCMQNKWHNNELLAGWIIAMTGKGMLLVIDFFFGQKLFYNIYYIITIAATLFYIQRLYITSKFNMEDAR